MIKGDEGCKYWNSIGLLDKGYVNIFRSLKLIW